MGTFRGDQTDQKDSALLMTRVNWVSQLHSDHCREGRGGGGGVDLLDMSNKENKLQLFTLN